MSPLYLIGKEAVYQLLGRQLISYDYFMKYIYNIIIFMDNLCRRLRVSIERDMGGTIAAPKTVRFFVPYWISNDSSLPLAYQVVEIEPFEASDVDSIQISKTGKSATAAMRYPSTSLDRKPTGLRKNLQVLEVIEDTTPTPSMLSPQDYVGRGGVMLFSSRNDAYLSPRVGVAVAIRNSENYSPGVSLLELEKKVIQMATYISSKDCSRIWCFRVLTFEFMGITATS